MVVGGLLHFEHASINEKCQFSLSHYLGGTLTLTNLRLVWYCQFCCPSFWHSHAWLCHHHKAARRSRDWSCSMGFQRLKARSFEGPFSTFSQQASLCKGNNHWSKRLIPMYQCVIKCDWRCWWLCHSPRSLSSLNRTLFLIGSFHYSGGPCGVESSRWSAEELVSRAVRILALTRM